MRGVGAICRRLERVFPGRQPQQTQHRPRPENAGRRRESARAARPDADVFIENFKPGSLDKLGFGYDAMHALNPRLVYCSITGYGKTGPRRHLTGYDPIVQAESGFMDITGAPDGPPMRTGIAMTDYLAGPLCVRRHPAGPSGHAIGPDAVSTSTSHSSTRFSRRCRCRSASCRRRSGRRHVIGNDHPSIAPYEALHAKDGMVMVAAANGRLWKQLCEAAGAGELIEDSRFRTNTDRVGNRPALKQELESRFAGHTVDALIERLGEFGVPCGRVRTVAEALDDPQIGPRQMLIPFDDPELGTFRVVGNPIKLSDTPAVMSRRPPKLGEQTAEILKELGLATE